MDYCDVFVRCLDSDSDGTHSLQSIHWSVSDGMLHFYKSRNLHLHVELNFKLIFFLGQLFT